MLLRLWRGDAVTDDEAELLGACLVASIDHGPLSPSALVTRTIASTRAAPMSGLAGGILAFGELHGAVVSRAMRILASAPAEGDLDAWADGVFEQSVRLDAACPASDTAGITMISARNGCSKSLPLHPMEGTRAPSSAGRPGQPAHGGTDPVNIDGALAVALTALGSTPAYGDFLRHCPELRAGGALRGRTGP